MNESDKFRQWNKSRVVVLDSPEAILRHREACENVLDSMCGVRGSPYPMHHPERAKIELYIDNLERKII